MKKKILLSGISVAFLAGLFFTMSRFSLAATGPVVLNSPVNAPSFKDLLASIIVNFFFGGAGIVAVLYLAVNGYKYIMSSGDEKEVESAKKGIQNAITGIVVVLASAGIVTFILVNVLGVSSNNFLLPPGAFPAGLALNNIIDSLTKFAFGAVSIVAVIYIVLAGYRYLSSGGDEKQAEEAKRAITNSVIGIGVVLLARAVVDFVTGINFLNSVGINFIFLPTSPVKGDLLQAIGHIVNFAVGFVGVIGVIFLVLAGYTYVTANGDESKIESAKRIIIWAAVGIGVALASIAIVTVVQRVLIRGA